MTLRNPGRLAIHRRSDEIAFLQQRLHAIQPESQAKTLPATQDQPPSAEQVLQFEALARECDLADELLHTRQTEPLGETLQRRLAMAEHICRDLLPAQNNTHSQDRIPGAYRVAEIERQALTEMLKHWWAWLGES